MNQQMMSYQEECIKDESFEIDDMDVSENYEEALDEDGISDFEEAFLRGYTTSLEL